MKSMIVMRFSSCGAGCCITVQGRVESFQLCISQILPAKQEPERNTSCSGESYRCRTAGCCSTPSARPSCTSACRCRAACSPGHSQRRWRCRQSGPRHWLWTRTVAPLGHRSGRARNLDVVRESVSKANPWWWHVVRTIAVFLFQFFWTWKQHF